jgi:hypothetical protein
MPNIGDAIDRAFEALPADVMTKDGLPADAFAYVPDPTLPSTWGLRIDDHMHTVAAADALGPLGFHGQKYAVPAHHRDYVVEKVREAYARFFPTRTAAEYPEAIRPEA